MRKVFVGAVLFYPSGTNPYNQTTKNDYRTGDKRVEALRAFRATGQLPEGYSLWRDSGEKGDITNPDDIDWAHMRD